MKTNVYQVNTCLIGLPPSLNTKHIRFSMCMNKFLSDLCQERKLLTLSLLLALSCSLAVDGPEYFSNWFMESCHTALICERAGHELESALPY